MSSILHWLGTLTIPVSATNETYNLLNEPLGDTGVGLGIIPADPLGKLRVRPRDGSQRGIVLGIDNISGVAGIYLARPQDIPAAGDETTYPGQMNVCPANSYLQTDPLDLWTWRVVIRVLAGAQGSISVSHTGQGWK